MAYQKKQYTKKTEAPKTWADHTFLTYAPNEQQADIMAMVRTGENGKVLALAGTGKTSTLRLITEDPANRDKKFLYLAFNRGVADKASAEFPPNCKCINPHRLAWWHNMKVNARRNGQYPEGATVARLLHATGFEWGTGPEDFLSVDQVGATISEAIGNFCRTTDKRPTAYHVKRTPMFKRIPQDHQERFIEHVLPYVETAWEDIADPNGSLPYMPGRGDGCYLKLWSLSNPTLYGYDVILYDEAQDANPPTAHVVEIQRNTQRIYVGDSNQAIYGFTGAIDALSSFEAEWVRPLTQSFRFGSAIAEAGNAVLAHIPGNQLTLEGYDQIDSTVTDDMVPDCILCRTNAGVIENALAAVEAGLNVAIAGGTSEIENFTNEAQKMIDPDAAYQRHTDKQADRGKRPVPREKYLKVKHPQLNSFHSWAQVTQAVDEGDASDMAMMVRIITKYGCETIYQVIDNSTALRDGTNLAEWAAQPGNVMVSTAHKAKGLEWDNVRIGGDFLPPKEGKTLAIAELYLIYVAVTRARKQLDKSALAWLDAMAADMLNGGDEGLGAI